MRTRISSLVSIKSSNYIHVDSAWVAHRAIPRNSEEIASEFHIQLSRGQLVKYIHWYPAKALNHHDTVFWKDGKCWRFRCFVPSRIGRHKTRHGLIFNLRNTSSSCWFFVELSTALGCWVREKFPLYLGFYINRFWFWRFFDVLFAIEFHSLFPSRKLFLPL